MLNLLPRDEKKHIKGEYVKRLSIVVFGGILSTMFVGLTLLLPAFFLSEVRENALIEQSIDMGKSTEGSGREELERILDETQQKIDILTAKKDETPLRSIFDAILRHRTEGVELTGLFYTKDGETVTLTTSGVALRRNDLLQFSRTLEEDPLFTDIELPVSNLANDSNILFTVSIKGDF
jgi:hypothetical protein